MVYSSGTLWLFGGYQSSHGYFNDLWAFHLTSKTWEPFQIPSLPEGRQFHAMSTFERFDPSRNLIKSDLYISGGSNYLTKQVFDGLDKIEGLGQNNITRSSVLTSVPKEGHSMIAVGNTLIQLSGCNTLKNECFNTLSILKI